jgi:hypothetical protein
VLFFQGLWLAQLLSNIPYPEISHFYVTDGVKTGSSSVHALLEKNATNAATATQQASSFTIEHKVRKPFNR